MRSETEYRGRKITSVYLTDGDYLVTVEGLKANFWTVEEAKRAIDDADRARRWSSSWINGGSWNDEEEGAR